MTSRDPRRIEQARQAAAYIIASDALRECLLDDNCPKARLQRGRIRMKRAAVDLELQLWAYRVIRNDAIYILSSELAQ